MSAPLDTSDGFNQCVSQKKTRCGSPKKRLSFFELQCFHSCCIWGTFFFPLLHATNLDPYTPKLPKGWLSRLGSLLSSQVRLCLTHCTQNGLALQSSSVFWTVSAALHFLPVLTAIPATDTLTSLNRHEWTKTVGLHPRSLAVVGSVMKLCWNSEESCCVTKLWTNLLPKV